MINFIRKEIFDCMEQSQPTFTIPSQLGKKCSPLKWNGNTDGQAHQRRQHVVLHLHIFRYLTKKSKKTWQPGSNLDLSCVRQLDSAPFCENYWNLYLDTKNFWYSFFSKKTTTTTTTTKKRSSFRLISHCPNFLD